MVPPRRFQLILQAMDDWIVSNGPEDFLYGRYFFKSVAGFAKARVRTPTVSVRPTSGIRSGMTSSGLTRGTRAASAIALPAKGALGSGSVVSDSTVYGQAASSGGS